MKLFHVSVIVINCDKSLLREMKHEWNRKEGSYRQHFHPTLLLGIKVQISSRRTPLFSFSRLRYDSINSYLRAPSSRSYRTDLEPEETQSGRDYLIVANRCLPRAIDEGIGNRAKGKIGNKDGVQRQASRDGERSYRFRRGRAKRSAVSVIKSESACRWFRLLWP